MIRQIFRWCLFDLVCFIMLLTGVLGCRRPSDTSANDPRPEKPPIRALASVEDFPVKLTVFETVFWEPRDTTSLRELIRDTQLVENKRVLEIGTGSGLVSLCCLQAGAKHAVATDVNSNAVMNADYNAEMLELHDRLETRLVPLDNMSAFAAIGKGERFDLIISNPPWEDQPPTSIDEYALYDEGFRLLDSLLSDLEQHLEPKGRCFLAYGNVTAIRAVINTAPKYDLNVQIRDDRNLDELPENFLPGMLLEVTPK